MELVLVGTVHGDLLGPRRLNRLLSRLRPDVLTVEGSEKGIQIFKENYESDLKRTIEWAREKSSKFASLLEGLDHTDGYECDIPRAYAEENNIPFHPIDDPAQFSALRDSTWSGLKDFCSKIPDFQFDFVNEQSILNGHGQFYALTQRAIDGDRSANEILLSQTRGTYVGSRDEYMETHLRRIAGDHPDSRIVHVGGCLHILDDPKGMTLYSRIADLKPKRVVLIEADE